MNKIQLNIPTAEEARKGYVKELYEKASKQAKDVEKRINDAITRGQISISGEGCLEPFIRKLLEEKGYVYSSVNQYNENYWYVTWA